MNHSANNDATARVLNLLSTKILGSKAKVHLTEDTPLLSSGLGLDSVTVLELVMELESEFGVSFDDKDLSVELFKSARTLAQAAEEKVRARTVAAEGATKRDRP